MVALSGPLGERALPGQGAGHEDDVGVEVGGAFESGPAEAGIEMLGVVGIEIELLDAEAEGFVHDTPDKSSANSAAAVLGADENAGEPWGEFVARVHVAGDEFGGTEGLGAVEGDDDGGDGGAAASAAKAFDTALDRVARAEVMPLIVMPARQVGNEMRVVGEVIDLHGAEIPEVSQRGLSATKFRTLEPVLKMLRFLGNVWDLLSQR